MTSRADPRVLPRDPVERVFLEDVARRGHRPVRRARERTASCARCATSARTSSRPATAAGCSPTAASRRRADGHRRGARRRPSSGRLRGRDLPRPREDRPGQPVYVIDEPPAAGRTGLAPGDARRPRAAPSRLRGGARPGARRRPAARRRRGLPLAHARQIEEGRSWLWTEDGVILFKAEASAWTPSGPAPAGVGRPAAGGAAVDGAARPARPLPRLLERVPRCACSSARTTAPAIRLYEAIGMDARALRFADSSSDGCFEFILGCGNFGGIWLRPLARRERRDGGARRLRCWTRRGLTASVASTLRRRTAAARASG